MKTSYFKCVLELILSSLEIIQVYLGAKLAKELTIMISPILRRIFPVN